VPKLVRVVTIFSMRSVLTSMSIAWSCASGICGTRGEPSVEGGQLALEQDAHSAFKAPGRDSHEVE
jgi:hypothetical protein